MARKSSSAKARKSARDRERQWQRWERRVVGLALGLLVILAASIVIFRGQKGGVESVEGEIAVTDLQTAAEVGALAPDFELPSQDGRLLKLSDYRGQPVAVTFMHTW